MKYIQNNNRSFSEDLLNEKQKSSVFFLRLSKLAITESDFPLIYSQFFILSRLITPSIFDVFTSLSSRQAMNICFVLFCRQAGNNMSIGVSLY